MVAACSYLYVFLLQPLERHVLVDIVLAPVYWPSWFPLPTGWQFCRFSQIVVFPPSLPVPIPAESGDSQFLLYSLYVRLRFNLYSIYSRLLSAFMNAYYHSHFSYLEEEFVFVPQDPTAAYINTGWMSVQ